MLKNAVSYYARKAKCKALLLIGLKMWQWFDNGADVFYVYNTKFYYDWMWFLSIYIVIQPWISYLIKAFEAIENNSHAAAIFLANFFHLQHALERSDYEAQDVNTRSMLIFAFLEDIP
jgi:hypothetical protein